MWLIPSWSCLTPMQRSSNWELSNSRAQFLHGLCNPLHTILSYVVSPISYFEDVDSEHHMLTCYVQQSMGSCSFLQNPTSNLLIRVYHDC